MRRIERGDPVEALHWDCFGKNACLYHVGLRLEHAANELKDLDWAERFTVYLKLSLLDHFQVEYIVDEAKKQV